MVTTAANIYEELNSALHSFILGRVGNHEVAEDILQDVYLRIHSRIDTLRDEEKVRSWVYQIARNAIHDHHRSARPSSELRDVPYTPDDPAENEVAAGLATSVRSFLNCLPPDYRVALVLTEYEDLTRVELAERLGLSISGAKSRVQRARVRLKALLLACCHFELDRFGGVINYQPRAECCATCDEDAGCRP